MRCSTEYPHLYYTYALGSPVLILSNEDPYTAILAYERGPQCGLHHPHMTYINEVNLPGCCPVAGIVGYRPWAQSSLATSTRGVHRSENYMAKTSYFPERNSWDASEADPFCQISLIHNRHVVQNSLTRARA